MVIDADPEPSAAGLNLWLAELGQVPVVGVAPVTDTVVEMDGSRVGPAVDRDALQRVTGPVVVPAGCLADLELLTDPPADLAAVVECLLARGPVEPRTP